MQTLLAPHDRPTPPAYWVTAALCGGVVLLSAGTAEWFPRGWVDTLTSLLPAGLPVLSGLASLAIGLVVALIGIGTVLVALRWPWIGVALAVPGLLRPLVLGYSLTFAPLVVLGAVVLLTTWRRPVASVTGATLGLLSVVVTMTAGLPVLAPLSLSEAPGAGRNVAVGLFYACFFVGAAGSGLLLRRSVLREEERRLLTQRAGAVEEQSAVVEERARLARDLHDVVAHHVSLIAVRAETAPYTQQDLGDGARTVLADIAADARLALDELRGVLGILGRSGEDAERAPQPTWSDITALVERTRAAGLDVTMTGDTAAIVSPGVGYAAYRVVQEGLTNARKHAPGAAVRVELEASDTLVHVSIRNAASAGPASGGRGLIGMGERVSALGGRMTAGVVAGVYLLDVTLPVVTG